MNAAYLTELEITRELRLPDKIGRIAMATWKMQPSFPKPAEGMGGRRFWPEVEQWLMALHGVGAVTTHHAPIPLAGSKAEARMVDTTQGRCHEYMTVVQCRQHRRAAHAMDFPRSRLNRLSLSSWGCGKRTSSANGFPSSGRACRM
jgi:hypothetical protein